MIIDVELFTFEIFQKYLLTIKINYYKHHLATFLGLKHEICLKNPILRHCVSHISHENVIELGQAKVASRKLFYPSVLK